MSKAAGKKKYPDWFDGECGEMDLRYASILTIFMAREVLNNLGEVDGVPTINGLKSAHVASLYAAIDHLEHKTNEFERIFEGLGGRYHYGKGAEA